MTDSVTLQARLSAIEAAIASGTLRVSIDGVGSTDFRSLRELKQVRDELRRDLGVARPIRRTVARFSNGL